MELLNHKPGDHGYLEHAGKAYPKLVEALHAMTHDGPHVERMRLINAILEEIGEAE